MKLTAKLPLVLFSALLLILFQSCGKNDSATDGATITISPSAVTFILADTTTFDLTATVRYKDGTPYPKAVLTITGSFAQPRNATNTTPRYQFYNNANGELNPNSIKVDSGFTAQADDYGNYHFSITVYGLVGGVKNTFTDSINIYSGSAFGTVAVSIT